MGEPALSLDQAKEAVSKTTHPRVTEQSIKEQISKVEYHQHGLMSVCFITMRNGFIVHGVSAPASPENYIEDVGRRYAYDNAFKQLWQLEGYLLCERLRGERASFF
jgi:hypothetical protein